MTTRVLTHTSDFEKSPLSSPTSWFLRLRAGAVCLHICLLLTLHLGFALELDLRKAFGLVALQGLSNILLSRRVLHSWELGLTLHADILLLACLLHLTGGAANPFSILFLLYVFLSAIFLTASWTYSTSLFSSLCFAFLLLEPADSLHIHAGEALLSLHLHGMWVAYLVVALLSTYFLTEIMGALRRQQKTLLELERLRANDEKLLSLATLAAGAGHELATPLSSIALASSELEASIEESAPHNELLEDVSLIRREVQRCKKILETMAFKGGGHRGELLVTLPSATLIEELLERISQPRRVTVSVSTGVSLITCYREGLLQVLTALVTNALDAADVCSLSVVQDEEGISFLISDSGRGIAPEILGRIGDPFFTTKPPGRGTGLGLFLVRRTVEEWRGELVIESDEKGTLVHLKLPQERQ